MSSDGRSEPATLGLIGLGTMGRNLALNIADHGHAVAVWNRRAEVTERFLAENADARLVPTRNYDELFAALERPRRIVLMVTAGAPVDRVIEDLRSRLQPGDVLIDGGNSWFQDTERRQEALRSAGVHFLGMGVSGGERGARVGPSLMPGGPREAYDALRPVLEAVAAQTDTGPCVAWCGPGGAGHFVKMVHNGIEYGFLQAIAEAYAVLRHGVGLEGDELADTFAEWNEGELQSFLVELAAQVLRVPDPKTSRPLVESVDDRAGQKGTGRWTVRIALELGVPLPTVSAAVDARFLSSRSDERAQIAKRIPGPTGDAAKPDPAELRAGVRDALYGSLICAFAQGMALVQAASREWHWDVRLDEMARIWRGGCIVRARLLDRIRAAFGGAPQLPNLLLDEGVAGELDRAQAGWRHALCVGQRLGIATPALSASLAYLDAFRSERLPLALTQAQRDAFGSHTYHRTDDPNGAAVHTDWIAEARKRSRAARR